MQLKKIPPLFFKISCLVLILGLFLVFQNTTLPVYFVYISPTGSDDSAADGSSQKPFLTLQKALFVATPLAQSTSYSGVVIKVKPGVYLGQSVAWNLVSPSSSTFTNPFSRYVNRPIRTPITIESEHKYDWGHFQGSGKLPNTTFFTFNYQLQDTKLTLRNIRISKYLTSAVALRGHTSDPNRYNSNTTLENIIFDKIGSEYVFNNSASYAALSLINSRNNTIRKNIFSRIDDFDYASLITDSQTGQLKLAQSTGLHAIYASFYSMGNQITENTFQNLKFGQVIKLRDQSHDNVISNNNFLFVGNDLVRNASGAWIQAAARPAIYSWYCDRVTNDDCDQNKIECPNYNTIISNNRVIEESIVENSTAVGVDKLIYIHWYPKYDPAPTKTFCTPDKIKSPYNQQATVDNPRGVLTGNTNQGCFVSVDNCPYMNKQDLYEFPDSLSTSHSSSLNCASRVSGWFGSCIKDIGTQPMMVRTRFLRADNVVSQTVKGNGCIVTASYCPRMDFWENMSKIDAKPEAHLSLSACQNRADDWHQSCTTDMTEQYEIDKVKIKVEYFQAGEKLGEKVYPAH